MTLFGSTNLSKRSAERDIELGFVMVVPDAEKSLDTDDRRSLRARLAEEVSGLWANGRPWKGGENEPDVREERQVRWGTKCLTWLVGGML